MIKQYVEGFGVLGFCGFRGFRRFRKASQTSIKAENREPYLLVLNMAYRRRSYRRRRAPRRRTFRRRTFRRRRTPRVQPDGMVKEKITIRLRIVKDSTVGYQQGILIAPFYNAALGTTRVVTPYTNNT